MAASWLPPLPASATRLFRAPSWRGPKARRRVITPRSWRAEACGPWLGRRRMARDRTFIDGTSSRAWKQAGVLDSSSAPHESFHPQAAHDLPRPPESFRRSSCLPSSSRCPAASPWSRRRTRALPATSSGSPSIDACLQRVCLPPHAASTASRTGRNPSGWADWPSRLGWTSRSWRQSRKDRRTRVTDGGAASDSGTAFLSAEATPTGGSAPPA